MRLRAAVVVEAKLAEYCELYPRIGRVIRSPQVALELVIGG